MAKRKAVLADDTKVTKTTLADAPNATRKLTDIKVEEVSIVDFPANGEPFVVMKSLNKENVEKASRDQIPLEKMKELHEKLLSVQNTLKLVNNELESSKVEKSVDSEPIVLKGLFNNIIHVLKSIRGDEDAAPISYEDVEKQYENVKKGNAISFLTRDRYAYVTQSISEYVTTYVDGIEHDDEGPSLIPLGLDSGVDESIDKMEDVVGTPQENDVDKEEINKNVDKIKSLEEEISTLKKQLENANVSEEKVNKKGSKISKDRLKKLKSIANDIGNAHDQMSKFLIDLDNGSDDREETNKMSDETKVKEVTEEVAEKAEEVTEEVAEKAEEVTEKKAKEQPNDQLNQLENMFKTLCEKLDSRFEKLEESQKANSEELKKFTSMRVDSKLETKDETPVDKSLDEIKKEKASFKSIFRLQ